MTINFDTLVSDLRTSERVINFTKRDGTVRRLRCTLQEGRIPPNTTTASSEPKVPNPNTLVVWDVEKSAWRSFRKDSVLNVEE